MEWWRGAVIYQIYPRSFLDASGDGVGDLKGIATKLDYISSLGVDGVWLSPFFASPMKDFGYDVSDYCAVDPLFGDLDHFDRLADGLRGRGLKLIIDQVYSHTSDRHPWFMESRSSRSNEKADWYVWADARADGTPPNNWLSVFGGPAWTWDARRRQYYLHNFLSEQPDLNFHQPAVRAAVLDAARFWLARGVDGFRLDVANFYYCDRLLRDNPPKRPEGGFARPYLHQRHLHDRSQPETLEFLKELRALLDERPGRMSVAEIVSDDPIRRTAEYAAPDRLHTAYNFHFLQESRLTVELVRGAFPPDAGDAWPSWSFSNHDVVRAASRFGAGGNGGPRRAQMLLALLLSLRGTIFIYQGEELGLPQAEVPFERLRDPEGIRFWPDNLGRDGSRTPMPWDAEAVQAGFSRREPWLPVDPRHVGLSVTSQERDVNSTLNVARRLIALRRNSPALKWGSIAFENAPADVVAFTRRHNGDTVFCAFNLSDREARLASAPEPQAAGFALGAEFSGGELHLAPHGAAILV